MKPKELIHAHIDLVRHMESTTFVTTLWKSIAPDLNVGSTIGVPLQEAARQAHCYRVSDTMSTYIQYAATQLDRTDHWDPSLAPTRAGLVRFDTPINMVDIHGGIAKVHWILWGDHEVGTVIFMFNDHTDPDDYSKEYLLRRTPDHREMVSILGDWGAVIGTASKAGIRLGNAFSGSPPEAAVDLLNQGAQPLTQANASRIVHALWLMLSQSITQKNSDGALPTEHVRRTTQQVAQRAGLPGTISVIQLRRTETRGAEAKTDPATRTHQWLTRGHWRWQRYGIGLTDRKRIWIDEHIKGPEGTPLIIPKKVYDVRR